MTSGGGVPRKISGYAPVHGLAMYYEIEGAGKPLVFIPPAFGHAGSQTFPALVQNHSVLTVDLQGHGRTADLPGRPLSIEQYAEDVVGLLKWLGIPKTDLLGESYGASTAALIALRYPGLVDRVAAYGATFGPPGVAINPATIPSGDPPAADSQYIRHQRERYEKVAPRPEDWPAIYEKVGKIRWSGFTDAELASMRAPVLILVGDHDFVRLEHAVQAFQRIPGAELAVIPDASHFSLSSEQDRVIPVVKHFLEKPGERLPLAIGGLGYRPGHSR
jgi:pimeloyl-ACP methyl ester carboxylesterase